jgi:Regulator of chromosome condensation (RCC1) repeat
VRSDGECVVWGWGRQDMNQLGLSDSDRLVSDYHRPIPLSLPCGGIREVWAGSEYSLALDRFNRLWSCGWNEHGNLGVGFVSSPGSGSLSTTMDWSPVVTERGQVEIGSPWTESIACGGAHVICAL